MSWFVRSWEKKSFLKIDSYSNWKTPAIKVSFLSWCWPEFSVKIQISFPREMEFECEIRHTKNSYLGCKIDKKKSHTAEKLFDRKCATKKIGTPAKIGTQNEDIFFGGFGFKVVKNTGWLSKILLVRIFSIFWLIN